MQLRVHSIHVRPGLTLLELLIASVSTVCVAAAGTGMVLAVSYAAGTLRSGGSAAASGHSALARLSQAVRGARLIGYQDPGSLVLWYGDQNRDDRPQFSETELYWLDAAHQTLYRTRPYASSMTSAQIALTDSVLAFSDLTSPTMPGRILGSANAESVILAGDVTSFQLKANAAPGSANLVDVRLTSNEDGLSKRFAACCTPCAPADYLLDSTRYDVDDVGARPRRKAMRTWTVPTAAAIAW